MRRMIRASLCVSAVMFYSACAPAAPPPAAPAGPTPAEMVAAAHALDQRFIDAFNKGDVDGLMATYWNSPNLVSFSPDSMMAHGYDAAKTGTVEMVKNMAGGKLEFLSMHNDVHGDMVLGWGTWRLTVPGKPKPQIVEGRYSDVKAMRDGKWVYLMDHASVPLPPPPPDNKTKKN
jgi:ketosteroid isomerase-like protein